MTHLLIDCCTLIHLNSIEGVNNHLLELQNQIDSNRITLLSHTLSIKEWEKHKEKDKKRKERKLLSYKGGEVHSSNDFNSNLSSNISVNTQHLDLQAQLIDELLSKALVLTTPDVIKLEFAERYRARLAPFHKKQNSQNDWEMIGSVCNYCEINGINNLYFLSGNHTDFADEKDVLRTIHPDIQRRFLKVKIHYYKNYSDFFREIHNTETFLPQLLSSQLIHNNKYNYNSTMKQSDLDSLYYLYNELYREINFIPLHMLVKFYPFSVNENSNAYYSSFTIYYIRQTLLHFFENLILNADKDINYKDELLLSSITNYKEKTEFVLRRLSQNLVFNVSGDENRRVANIHHYKLQVCYCYQCSFNRFEFYKTYANLKEEEFDLKEKLKFAYIHYQYGNYEKAAKVYQKIAQEAVRQKKYITYFISKYNLKHLSLFLQNFFLHDKINHELINELKQIDPLEEAVKLKGSSDYNLLSFIAQEDFFTEAFQKISDKRNDILSHYYLQLNGGWSSNEHIRELIGEFAKLEVFLNNNYIIFDKFSDFEKLFELVTEAIFASHAINEKQGDRFTSFDDYWIHKFINYGKADSLKRYFNRYHLKSLKYRESNTEKDTFIELAEHLFQSWNDDKKGYSFVRERDNNYMVHYVNHLFQNIVTIGSFLELPNDTLNKFASLLLNFLKVKNILDPASFRSITYFISKKRKVLNESLLLEFFQHFLYAKEHHGNEIMEAILGSNSNEAVMQMSQIDFDNFLSFCKGMEESNAKFRTSILPILFSKVDVEKKDKIKKVIEEELNNHFDFSLYYLASIYDVLPLNKDKILQLVDEINVDEMNKAPRVLWGNAEYQNDYLNRLFNICFKYNLVIKTPFFEKLKKVHPYYEWLIDMDAFDYTNFNPEWILAYPTVYYHRKMSKSPNLIDAIVKYLHSSSHSGIEQTLLKITYYMEN